MYMTHFMHAQLDFAYLHVVKVYIMSWNFEQIQNRASLSNQLESMVCRILNFQYRWEMRNEGRKKYFALNSISSQWTWDRHGALIMECGIVEYTWTEDVFYFCHYIILIAFNSRCERPILYVSQLISFMEHSNHFHIRTDRHMTHAS